MRKTFLNIILLQFTLLYSDTTIVAFDAVHQYFGSLGNNRTVIDTIQYPDSNTGYSNLLHTLDLGPLYLAIIFFLIPFSF